MLFTGNLWCVRPFRMYSLIKFLQQSCMESIIVTLFLLMWQSKLKEFDLLNVRQLLCVGAEIQIQDIQLWKAIVPRPKITN